MKFGVSKLAAATPNLWLFHAFEDSDRHFFVGLYHTKDTDFYCLIARFGRLLPFGEIQVRKWFPRGSWKVMPVTRIPEQLTRKF